MPAFNLSPQGRNDVIQAVRSSIFNSGIADATLAPLTTRAGLRAALLAVNVHGSQAVDNFIRLGKDFDIAVADGIIDDTMVAAGDTRALLIAALDAKHTAGASLSNRPAHSHFNR